MKVARFVLKIVAASLALAALTCCVIAYFDELTALITPKNKKPVRTPSEYDDYADWDE